MVALLGFPAAASARFIDQPRTKTYTAIKNQTRKLLTLLHGWTVFLYNWGLPFEPGRITDRVRNLVDAAHIGKQGEEEPGRTVDDLLETLAKEAEEKDGECWDRSKGRPGSGTQS